MPFVQQFRRSWRVVLGGRVLAVSLTRGRAEEICRKALEQHLRAR